jgi:hypothetical protein
MTWILCCPLGTADSLVQGERAGVQAMSLEFSAPIFLKIFPFFIQAPETRSGYIQTHRMSCVQIIQTVLPHHLSPREAPHPTEPIRWYNLRWGLDPEPEVIRANPGLQQLG